MRDAVEGSNHVTFLDREEDGEYDITMPNMYARGILFGKVSPCVFLVNLNHPKADA